MGTQHGRLSPQAIKRLQGSELIRKGYDNGEIAGIVEVAICTVRRWQRKLKDNGECPIITKMKAPAPLRKRNNPVGFRCQKSFASEEKTECHAP